MDVRLSVHAPTTGRPPVDVVVTAAPGTTMATLAPRLLEAVGLPYGRLFAGTGRVPESTVLGVAPLVDGALLTVDAPGPAEIPGGLLELRVVGGPDAGAVHALGPGESQIGRAPEAAIRVNDPDVSRLHAVLTVGRDGVILRDLNATNGTYVDGHRLGAEPVPVHPRQLIRTGESTLMLVTPDEPIAAVRADGEGRVEVNRPPRLRPPVNRVEIALPDPPAPHEKRPLPVVMIVAPLVLGVVLYLLLHQVYLLSMVLVSPMLGLGQWWADRRGGRTSYRNKVAAYEQQKAQAEARIAYAVGEEQQLRRQAAPDAAALLLAVLGPRPRLWERRWSDDDALSIRLGLSDQPAAVTVRSGATEPPARTMARAVPATVPLAAVGVLGIAGPRQRLEGVARWAVAQLAGLHSPRDLSLVLLCAGETGSRWQWARWLPHVTPAAGEDCVALVAVDQHQYTARIAELTLHLEARQEAHKETLGAARGRWAGPVTVVVLDGAPALRGLPGLARLLREGPEVGIYFLCLADDEMQLPQECRAVAVVTGEVGTRLRIAVAGETPLENVSADMVSSAWVDRFARAMAPLRDATPEGTTAGLPDSCRLLDLLDLDPPSGTAVLTRWRAGGYDTRAVVGVTLDGPFAVDLRADGPHALVGGTTGAGKSELLQTLIASLAVANRPDEMTFVLIDYKGGAAFKDCARLPHAVGTVTDLDGHLAERALTSLAAELRRREEVLLSAGAKDIENYRESYRASGRPDQPPLPRLLLVVDEFASLKEELPDFMSALVGLAMRGRSLGLHMLLATQRPGGAVSPEIRANTNLRIALRVLDPAESQDIIDTRDAALIAPSTPGRAYARTGGPPVLFQTARVGGRQRRTGELATAVRPQPWPSLGDPVPRQADSVEEEGPTDLARLVDAVRQAAATLELPPIPPPWLPPLPEVVTAGDVVQHGPVGPEQIPVALVDVPQQQRREPYLLDLADGEHLLVAGAPRSGRSTALRTIAGGIAARCPVTDVHLYALDCGSGALMPLAALPHAGAVVPRDQVARGDRVLARLLDEVAARQELLSRQGFGSVAEQRAGAADPADRLPYLVLLVDSWEGFVSTYENVDSGRPLDAFFRLLREGPSAGLRVVVTGDRTGLAGRLGGVVPQKLTLRLADPADYLLAGIRAREVPRSMPAGRAMLTPGGLEAQIALMSTDPSGPGQVTVLGQLAEHANRRAAEVPAARRPFRVESLPASVAYADVAAGLSDQLPPLWTLIGVGGDELDPVGVDLAEEGPAFVVAGPARSGRSTALLTMARSLRDRGTPVVAVATRRSPLRGLDGEPGVAAVFGADDGNALAELLAGAERPVVVLIDDVTAFAESPLEEVLAGLARPHGDSPHALVIAGSSDEMGGIYRGVTVEARRNRCGLLLAPTSALDGDLLGVKLPRGLGGMVAQAGRGILTLRGALTTVQVAR